MTGEIENYIIQPEDVLNEQEYQLLQRAQAGEIPCPWCERPLTGSFYFLLEDGCQYKGVRLQCSGCGFDERQGIALLGFYTKRKPRHLLFGARVR